MKTFLLSGLVASALAFGGTDCGCDDKWSECVEIEATCADLLACMSDGTDFFDCAPTVDVAAVDAAWGTVLTCYGQCEGDDDMPAENPYIFNIDQADYSQTALEWHDEATCGGDPVLVTTCDVDDGEDDEAMQFWYDAAGQVIGIMCNADCSECSWDMAMDVSGIHGIALDTCDCDIPEEDDPGMCVLMQSQQD